MEWGRASQIGECGALAKAVSRGGIDAGAG